MNAPESASNRPVLYQHVGPPLVFPSAQPSQVFFRRNLEQGFWFDGINCSGGPVKGYGYPAHGPSKATTPK